MSDYKTENKYKTKKSSTPKRTPNTQYQEKPKGYIISDQRGMQMHYEPKPRFKHGGEAKCRGMGAAVKGGKFEGVF